MRLIIEGYLDMTISAFIQIQLISVKGVSDGIDLSYSMAMLAIAIVAPVLVVLFMRKFNSRLRNAEFQQKYDSLYSEYDIRLGSAKFFICYFFLRRLLFALTCVYLIDYPTFQIQAYILLCLLNILFLFLTRPYESPSANNTEIFNEITILALAIHLFLFTDFLVDDEMQTLVGYSLIGVVLFNVLVHLLIMLIHSLKSLCQLYQVLRRKYCPRKPPQKAKPVDVKQQDFSQIPKNTIEEPSIKPQKKATVSKNPKPDLISFRAPSIKQLTQQVKHSILQEEVEEEEQFRDELSMSEFMTPGNPSNEVIYQQKAAQMKQPIHKIPLNHAYESNVPLGRHQIDIQYDQMIKKKNRDAGREERFDSQETLEEAENNICFNQKVPIGRRQIQGSNFDVFDLIDKPTPINLQRPYPKYDPKKKIQTLRDVIEKPLHTYKSSNLIVEPGPPQPPITKLYQSQYQPSPQHNINFAQIEEVKDTDEPKQQLYGFNLDQLMGIKRPSFVEAKSDQYDPTEFVNTINQRTRSYSNILKTRTLNSNNNNAMYPSKSPNLMRNHSLRQNNNSPAVEDLIKAENIARKATRGNGRLLLYSPSKKK